MEATKEKIEEEPVMQPREVFIRADFDGDSHLPNEILSASTKVLSSVFDGRKPLSGLSDEEEREYLPKLIAASPNDSEWREKVNNFWAEISLDIPTDGFRLQVGKDRAGEPLDVEDWIYFQFAKAHPKVANSREEAEANPNIDFWIHDPVEARKKENQMKNKEAEAQAEYFQMRDDERKLDMIIRVMGDRSPSTLNDIEQKQNLVHDFVQERPVEFLKFANDDKLQRRAFVRSAINNEIIREVGGSFMYNDNVIGETVDDVIGWISDEHNSQQLNEIKARMDDIEGR